MEFQIAAMLKFLNLKIDMRILYCYFCLLLISSISFTQNLILNPDFEDFTTEDMRDASGDWKLNGIQWDKVGDGSAFVNEESANTGDYGFFFNKDNSAQGVNDITLRQDIPIVVGETYQISMDAKLEQVSGNYLRVSVKNFKNGQVGDVFFLENDTLETAAYDGWNTYSNTFSIPSSSSTDSVRLIIYRVAGGDSCSIDNVQLSIQQQVSHVYYVSSSIGDDSNSGLSIDQPWQSLEKLNSTSFIPGDTIKFKSGDEFIGQLKVSSSGEEGAPIVFTNYNQGSRPRINGSGAEGGDFEFAVLIENKEYIVLDGLEISNNRKNTRPDNKDTRSYGVLIRVNEPVSKRYFRLRNLTIMDVYPVNLDGVEFQDIEVSGIHVFVTANYANKEKHIKDLVIENCMITRSAKFGVWVKHDFAVADSVGNDTINRIMDVVIRNNHFLENGGSGITISKVYNCLVEHNQVRYSGFSGYDDRMVGRGSGIWFFNTYNAISQYNTLVHARGDIDSYSQHIDYLTRDVIMQYNYSEDNEGGFCQILGDNLKSTYRYNISVNDGFRVDDGTNGRVISLTDYAGNRKKRSDSIYIYNNTVMVSESIDPDFTLDAFNSFIFNNVFVGLGFSMIGEITDLPERSKEYIKLSNNLFHENVDEQFTSLDSSGVFEDPEFIGNEFSGSDNYQLFTESKARNRGVSFSEPSFPMAGKGIFKNIKPYPDTDFFGNNVDIVNTSPHIGAHAGGDSILEKKELKLTGIRLRKNPVSEKLQIEIPEDYKFRNATFQIVHLNGVVAQKEELFLSDDDIIYLTPQNNITNGIYVLNAFIDGKSSSESFVLIR